MSSRLPANRSSSRMRSVSIRTRSRDRGVSRSRAGGAGSPLSGRDYGLPASWNAGTNCDNARYGR